MCCYRLYIFQGCGHSTFSEMPVRYCKDARTTSSTQDGALSERSNVGTSVTGEGSGITTRSRSRASSAKRARITTTTAPPTSDKPVVTTPATKTEQHRTTPSTRSQAPRASAELLPCGEGRVHPFHCIRLDRLCPSCVEELEERLRILESSIKEIRFDPNRWHWKYQGGGKKRDGEGDGKGPVAGWAIGSWWTGKGAEGAVK
jgi:hypothetical protein